MDEKSFTGFLIDGINKNWEKKALSDYHGDDFAYKDVACLLMRIQ